jgi:hypothetical protein
MSNTITNVLPVVYAQGVLALRQNAIMTRLVNRNYQNLAAQKGDVINVPIPSALAASDVTPGYAAVTSTDIAPTKAVVTLDFWKKSQFTMTDRDMAQALDGVIPMEMSEAVKSLGNAIDSYILGKHTGFYNAAGAAGTTPFATTIAAGSEARKKLNKSLAPMDDRRAVLDPDGESNLLSLADILNFDKRGDQAGIVKGNIGEKLGFDWHLDQNITSYTPGTGWVTGFAASTVAGAVGDTTLNVLNATASGTIKIGDIFTVGGGSQQYVVTVTTTVSATVQVAITFYPALVSAAATGAALTVIATAYVANLAFHRDAIAWVSRPLANDGLGNLIISDVDPVTGVALRLEVSRQHYQTTWSFDVMGGANVIRREFGCKILG